MRPLPEIKSSWVSEFGTEPEHMTKPYYVGIDPSLSAFAIVAVGTDWHYGQLIKVPPSLNMGARLVVYQYLVQQFFRYVYRDPPELVVVEGPGYGGHATSAWSLGGLYGAMLQAIWLEELDERTMALQPSTLKKYVTNNGNAKKNTIMREVFKVWDFEALDDNCADAYGLAQAAMTICNSTAKYAWQVAALKKQIGEHAERTGPIGARDRAQPAGSPRPLRRVHRSAPAEGRR